MKMKGSFLKINFKYGKQIRELKNHKSSLRNNVCNFRKMARVSSKHFYVISNWHSQVIWWQKKFPRFNILIKLIPFQSVLFSIYILKQY